VCILPVVLHACETILPVVLHGCETILPVILYGCETRYLTLRVEYNTEGICGQDAEENICIEDG
jgi:hypothetical protein